MGRPITKKPEWYGDTLAKWQQLSIFDRRKEWRAAHADELSTKNKSYYKDNVEKLSKKLEKQKVWRAANPNKMKVWKEANTEKLAVKAKVYRKANAVKISVTKKKYNAEHLEQNRINQKTCRDKKARVFYDMFGDGLGM